MRKILKIYLVLFIISTAVNFAWELSHFRLYRPLMTMELTTAHLLWFSVKDAWLYLSYILLVAFFAKNLLWFWASRAWEWAALLSLGFAASTAIEIHAINTGRWAYLPVMPIIPVLEVGLSPILQMSFGPVLALFLLLGFMNRSVSD